MSQETMHAPTFWGYAERPADELANFITHGLGFALSVPAAILLMITVMPSHSPGIQLACGAYCISLVGLYAASMLSHMFYDPARRRFYRTLDQACIYFLIVGSFTPWAALYLNQGGWQWLLPSMWTIACLGALLTFRTHDLSTIPKVSMYVAFGWLPASSLYVVFHQAPLAAIWWLIAGGIFYTVGTVFLIFDHKARYLHAMWHLFVIIGSSCHYLAILALVS